MRLHVGYLIENRTLAHFKKTDMDVILVVGVGIDVALV
jgi:tyrosyl-tRNA synthetase